MVVLKRKILPEGIGKYSSKEKGSESSKDAESQDDGKRL